MDFMSIQSKSPSPLESDLVTREIFTAQNESAPIVPCPKYFPMSDVVTSAPIRDVQQKLTNFLEAADEAPFTIQLLGTGQAVIQAENGARFSLTTLASENGETASFCLRRSNSDSIRPLDFPDLSLPRENPAATAAAKETIVNALTS